MIEFVVSFQLDLCAPALITLLKASKGLITEAPISAWWSVQPDVTCQMTTKMMLGPLEAGILWNHIERSAVRDLQIVHLFNVCDRNGVLNAEAKQLDKQKP